MREGTYSRWLMADIIDMGWCGSPLRHFIGILWGRWNKERTLRTVAVTTMAINTPWVSEDGRNMGETTQFQNIFRLLNDDKLILPSQYPGEEKWHKKWLEETKEIIKNNSLNFFIVFDKNEDKALKVCDIVLCTEDTIKNDGKFEWLPKYKAREVKPKEQPSLKTRSLYKKASVAVDTGVTCMQPSDTYYNISHTVSELDPEMVSESLL
jgi:hypothetical protein